MIGQLQLGERLYTHLIEVWGNGRELAILLNLDVTLVDLIL